MKILQLSIIALITFTLSTSTIIPVYAEGRESIFQKIENFIEEPFLSMEQAAGGDGHKRPHVSQSPQKHISFLSSWICQLLVSDIGNIFGTNNQDTFNAAGMCKGYTLK